MAIIKTDVTGQYFVVGMDVARDQRLGLTERGMLLTLLSLPPDWDFSIEYSPLIFFTINDGNRVSAWQPGGLQFIKGFVTSDSRCFC